MLCLLGWTKILLNSVPGGPARWLNSCPLVKLFLCVLGILSPPPPKKKKKKKIPIIFWPKRMIKKGEKMLLPPDWPQYRPPTGPETELVLGWPCFRHTHTHTHTYIYIYIYIYIYLWPTRLAFLCTKLIQFELSFNIFYYLKQCARLD